MSERDEDWLNPYEDEIEAERDRLTEEESCCFPGRCLMPGEHLRSECYTLEMAEEWDRISRELPRWSSLKPGDRVRVNLPQCAGLVGVLDEIQPSAGGELCAWINWTPPQPTRGCYYSLKVIERVG